MVAIRSVIRQSASHLISNQDNIRDVRTKDLLLVDRLAPCPVFIAFALIVTIVGVVPGEVGIENSDVISFTMAALVRPPLALPGWEIRELDDGGVGIVHDSFDGDGPS